MPNLNKVALVTEMMSSLKVWGLLLTLLCLRCGLLAQSKDISRREFMEKHHLSPSQEFSAYKCDFLMKEREALKHKIPHLFIYISWYKVEHICYSGNKNDHYRNVYVWAQVPIKVLKCHWEGFTDSYRESRSYNYIQFHCNINGYVDSIEDMKLIEPIFN
ncbi:epididymal secretory protein E3-beta [Fukomys damarensis]|uniref:epididymal secretory protein E3-beta n=1 Tax=Fukomys damarensis TaxID=885580 RepID=UPI00053F63DB|nr:epididymal secretory protein E3-beta [Fukomys damarensis]XP_010642535.1 epididymal secretory protein E3-beta [Fukomys damarensis]